MKIIVYINFVLTILLIGGFFWLLFYQKPKEIVYVTPSSAPAETKVEEVIKTVFITPVPTVTVTKTNQTTYIPITGPITTTSSSWYDAPGTEFYLNTADYGKTPYLTWSASLKVAHGNGTVYARLYDVTHGIAVNGSEVSISNKADLTQSYSGSLNFWANNNLYRVQVKSLNTFEVTFGGGRIKIIY
ncbi:hypothetical protein A2130_00945 [Candidatus Woesebacteria bacterium GWC2_33_12]|uniref:DUF5626 domain-containing protein n=1 Tax=Candidatus Woesebacteria bacterium GW2011_GWB1_33_22 TaxID=1618566 RepID=A0A0F9ZMF2_9BACT|nr:MAG: hypothetical protein UR29_C0002G0079 [Candidatus Woesebacteria bacterium GW2011_GWC2_33_12]KKP42551.1 MAG: hypothetical protein UR33_C0002G0127 [Candidatus Woesebacteria bacterium GW2011_GWA2_33_20]KKP45294.1 MAG: hypothetical protein UR35_C0002G0127 [Candidatus Woesebacteria bacterium GW2011_GWB1_33_22]KKP47122.1 MAG: hypothetical protein UR37_C0002G0034 [Microgenomates group bacterium GW2011_GWC1_33_28]KKP50964.1 MAG: hypothetical protein UR41_C0002G0128 [Candidatus Woesebacteria bact